MARVAINAGELAAMFGLVGLYGMEREVGQMLRFHRDGGRLATIEKGRQAT